MPRSQRSNSFGTRSSRFKHLSACKEHWTAADEGVSLGYRRGKTKSVWYVRTYKGSRKYEQKPIGLADDYQDADGEQILTYFQAQDRAKERARRARDQERPLLGRSGYTVADAVEAYLDHYRTESGKQTREVERVFHRDILPTLGSRPVESLTRQEIMNWRSGLIRQKPHNRARKPVEVDVSKTELKRRRKATAQRKWTMLRAALNHAFSSGDVSSDVVWRSIKPLRDIDAPPPSRILTAKECRVLTNKVDAEFRPIAQATFLTGAAFKELREATVDDYMPQSGHLRVFNTKRRARLVPLTDEGRRLFDSLAANKPRDKPIFTKATGEQWNKGMQGRRMKDASAAAKMSPAVTLTDLRDAYGSLLLNNGVSLEVVSKAMGHASIDTTKKHYAHLLQETVDSAIRGALPELGIEQQKIRRVL
ncbi:MAG: tyrosine-type recombinase/integrase [Candidatus Poribacteria bacterium]|nr:tyrosine-type recombinase/integrase [Candidatus Poribacteria bacterium]